MTIKNNISSHCRQLRLNALAEQVQQLADQASTDGISYLEFAAKLFEVEIQYRRDKELLIQIKLARLPGRHNLLDYNCSRVEGMPSPKLEQLKELTWLDQNFNLIIMGPNGIGKSFLASGLCHHAIAGGYRAYFRSMEDIMTMLKTKDISRAARVEHRRLSKAHFIVIDDIMMISIARSV